MADISIDEFCHNAAALPARNGGMVAEDAWAHYDRGIAWAHNGAYEQALEAWRKALRLNPNLAEAYAAIGDVYMTLGCWQEAIRNYRQAIQASPDLLESYYGLGSAYGRLGDYTHAIEAYQQAMQHLPAERPQPQEAVVSFHTPPQDSCRFAPDTFPERLRSDADGFDFSALLSSPQERRQAVRQEQASPPPANALALGENLFHPEAAPAPQHIAPTIADRSFQTAVVAAPAMPEAEAATDEEEAEEAYHVASPRERRAQAVLVMLLIVLGGMGGRMAIRAINEERDHQAYLEATRRNSQIRRASSDKPAVGRASE